MWKIKPHLPSTYFLILQSFFLDRFFCITIDSSTSPFFPQIAGVPQGSILSPLLFSVYTSDIPEHPSTILYSFADDTAILSSHKNPTIASIALQNHLHVIEKWFHKWGININPSKSTHVSFSLRKISCPAVTIANKPVPSKTHVRYLGLYLDKNSSGTFTLN